MLDFGIKIIKGHNFDMPHGDAAAIVQAKAAIIAGLDAMLDL